MLVLAALLCASLMVGSRALRVATYNTGLTRSLEQYERRVKHAPPAISEIKADVVCLQEVWYIKDMQTIMETSKETFPHSFSYYHADVNNMDSKPTEEVACPDPIKVKAALECAIANCSKFERSNILSCVNKMCSPQVMSLDQACLTCLVLSGDKEYKKCLTMAFNVPGLLILSRLPLLNAIKERYVPNKLLYLPRAYLQVDIADVGRIFCTHLTARIGPQSYERLDFTTYEEQQKSEIMDLVKLSGDIKVGEQKAVIVAGDLNSGPKVSAKNVEPDYASNYDLFMSNGFRDTYINEGGDCTWCADNPLTRGDAVNYIYDHILIRGAAFGSRSEKIMTEKLADSDYPISDHYGIIVDVEVKSYWRMLSEFTLVWFYSAYHGARSMLFT